MYVYVICTITDSVFVHRPMCIRDVCHNNNNILVYTLVYTPYIYIIGDYNNRYTGDL